MTEYFYTNQNLADIMIGDNEVDIPWEQRGFKISEVRTKQLQIFKKDKVLSLLPINDKTKFNKELGSLIAIGEDGEYFYKILNEEQAQIKKQEFEKIREQQRLEQEQKENKNNAELNELQDVVDSLAMENLKMKGVIQ